MFELEKDVRFEAAHKLPGHDGKCARLHGHSWRATVRIGGEQLITEGPKAGMLLDYGTLKDVVAPLVEEKLDHHYLNESIPLENPTSESIARWLALEVAKGLERAGVSGIRVSLLAVTIEETCTARCTYRPSPATLEQALLAQETAS